jgi:hypothetical protein
MGEQSETQCNHEYECLENKAYLALHNNRLVANEHRSSLTSNNENTCYLRFKSSIMVFTRLLTKHALYHHMHKVGCTGAAPCDSPVTEIWQSEKQAVKGNME